MSKRFQRGLVVGKFAPLHRGHEMLIHRALDECVEVVVVSYSKPELPGCEAARRDQWFSALFPQIRHLAITDERLRERLSRNESFALRAPELPGRSLGREPDPIPKVIRRTPDAAGFMGRVAPEERPIEVPDNGADETTHRRFCGFLCQRLLGVTVDAVFTSEDYGDAFAEELTGYFRERQPLCPVVKHVLVDRNRRAFRISGSMLRQDVHAHRQWLSPRVYASFVQRVCLLGGESSGKSTLAAALARLFDTACVAEFGRDLWEAKAGRLTFEDMRHIAKVQVQREEEAALRANRFLFCDTSPLTTLFYSRHLFGKAEPELERLAERPYDFTILCAPDFPFAQDGTRQPETFRMLQHEWYLKELTGRGIAYRWARGPLEDRVLQVQAVLACAAMRTG